MRGADGDGAGADQLETWLGVGDQNFTNVWAGDAGVGTASSWHAAVDGVGATFSIYDVTLVDGSSALIGGYTALDWSGLGDVTDLTAFIFNLTTGEAQFTQPNGNGSASIYTNSDYFATFGGGHDIFGGAITLGSYMGSAHSFSYDPSQGLITLAGDGTSGSGTNFTVKTLETYTFEPAATVPLPAGGLLLITALGGLGMARRRRR